MGPRSRPLALGRVAVLAAVAVLAGGRPAGAQTPPAGVAADTVWLEGVEAHGVAATPYPRPLAAGEPIAVWVESRVAIGAPELTGRPVPDAELGAVVARFERSSAFAWPARPVVWIAPSAGRLFFGLNAYAFHALSGRARIVIVPLAAPGSDARRAFPRPAIELERVPGGVVARYADRAGFGLVPSTLRLTITTNRGVVYDLAAWARPGERETFLPLPPPDVPLTPGVHTLSATIEDRLGNLAPPATIVFDAAP